MSMEAPMMPMPMKMLLMGGSLPKALVMSSWQVTITKGLAAV
ncbi:MAG: hypothetical protein BWY56_02316 [Acidobacteria bacterium ADurb.Bin340]|nr:MAG: hypothetical protein BWY56_02316 [Acidobacteria bacterium ADurb.Bin340]